MKKNKEKTRLVKIDGLIDMEGAPSEIKEFLVEFHKWLEKSKWSFEGTLLVPSVGDGMSVDKFKKLVKIRKVRRGLGSLIFSVVGVYAMAVFGFGQKNLIGIAAILLLWYSGMLFERSVNK